MNYLGEFVDGAAVAKVVLRVRTRYNKSAQTITNLKPQVWGLQFLETGEQLYTETFDNGMNGWVGKQAAVTDGKLITGTSAGCAIPFGLALIAALKGQDEADRIARQIVIR